MEETKRYSQVGMQYMDLVCDDCMKNIREQMLNVTSKDLLKPKKIMKQSTEWLCQLCINKIKHRLNETRKVNK